MRPTVTLLTLLGYLSVLTAQDVQGEAGPISGNEWYEHPTLWILLGLAFIGGLLWLRRKSRTPA